MTCIKFWNGYEMPLVGIGTWQSSDDDIMQCLDVALETGYRHIDTAWYYRNEAAIGKVLKKWLDSGKLKREELFVVTKLPSIANKPESVEKFIKKSLDALQLTYIDLYLIHNPVGLYDPREGEDFKIGDITNERIQLDKSTDLVAVWKAMETQVNAGRARSIGLSNFNSKQIARIVKESIIRPANLQVELHVYFQQRELVAFCSALGITVCAYGPVGSPALAKFLKGSKGDGSVPDLSPLTDPVVQTIAKKHNKTAAQVLLRYIIERGIAVIPKSSNAGRIKENFQVFDFELSEEETEMLDNLDKGRKGRIFSTDILPLFKEHPEFPYYERY